MAETENMIKTEAVQEAIAAFIATLAGSKEAAQKAAIAALIHTYQHREASQLRILMDAIKEHGKDYVRLAPFTLWLVKYAPVKMVNKAVEGGKKQRVLEFDKESKLLAVADQTIADATKKLWWTMSSDKEATAFDVVDFDKRILGIAKRALKEIEEQKVELSAAQLAHVRSVYDQFDLRVTAAKAMANKAAA